MLLLIFLHWRYRNSTTITGDSVSIYLHWFRRDLRVHDNTGLSAAARLGDAVLGAFVVDTRWFPADTGRTGPFQAAFWLMALGELGHSLLKLNIALKIIVSADPVAAIIAMAKEIKAEGITFNKEYEPDQIAMDQRLLREGQLAGMKIRGFKDAVIFEEFEILTSAEGVYTVFSPYKRAWLARLNDQFPDTPGLPRKSDELLRRTDSPPSAESLGHVKVVTDIPAGESGAKKMLADFCRNPIGNYNEARNYPAVDGGSRLSAHLSAGTISIRQCVAAAIAAAKSDHAKRDGADMWIAELIWREFYRMILFHYPHTVNQAFQSRFAGVNWTSNPKLIKAWTGAQTGYPIVDAAIRQLVTTGWMHNRLRMITAMFLVKDLDVDWRIGERFFMQWLMDYDQASNVGGWQWSAGTGTDAAPYFRVMNPILQAQRFDPQGLYVRRYLPALKNVPDHFIHEPVLMPSVLQRQQGCIIGSDYPAPVVDHATAREVAIARFKGL